MLTEVIIPSVGESIVTAKILSWHVADGSLVTAGEDLLELETEKVTITIQAEVSGKIKILIPEDQEISIGTVVASIDTQGAAGDNAVDGESSGGAVSSLGGAGVPACDSNAPESIERESFDRLAACPTESLEISRPDLEVPPKKERSGERRVRMSLLRQSLSRRLVSVKNETAMLTTFNEADMSAVQEIRRRHGDAFQEKYGVKLGLMSFFVKASAIALGEFPEANAYIDGYDVVYHDFMDVGFAASTDRGVVVPVIRHAEKLGLPEIEQAVSMLAERARKKMLTMEEMEGGTFTISNGGVFGSLLSTPILNPPQSAILGMHTIQDRPVVRESQIVIRPMMYLALSYDHRLLDGREAVGFLKRIKELLEKAQTLYDGPAKRKT